MIRHLIGLLFLFVTLLSCSSKSSKPIEEPNSTNFNWVTHCDTIDAGFIMAFKYPDNIVVADIIDNCRCVGDKIKSYDENEGSDSTNTRQWCICMQDTTDNSVQYFINTWKSDFKELASEQRDTITIDNLKAIRVTLKGNNKNNSYRQLIYLKKYATLFEIINIYEQTNKDFETFCKSIVINAYRKPSH